MIGAMIPRTEDRDVDVQMRDEEGLTAQERDVRRILNQRRLAQIRNRRQLQRPGWRRFPMDSRNDFQYRGGGNNRKRRFRDDDEYDRRSRRRYEEPLSVRFRKEILAVAESAFRRPEDEVKDLAKTITDNTEDDYFIRSVKDLIPQLVLEQPLKIPAIAAIILYTNNQKPEFAKNIVNAVTARLQDNLNTGNWRQVKLLLRFLACTQALFEGDGVFLVLEELFSRAVDLQTASSEDAVGLELVKIIQVTIPYALASVKGLEQKAEELLEKTDIIATTPHSLSQLVDPYVNDQNTSPTPILVNLLQKQLQAEASNNWELSFLPRLYQRPTQQEGSEEMDSEHKQEFPDISVPQPINPGPTALFPEVFFSLYADQEVETIPKTTDLASSLLRDSFVDTINTLEINRLAAARSLIDLDCYWQPNTFVKRATPFDKVKEMTGVATWKPEDLAMDAIFSQMLQLPTPEHKLVYYHSVITETCKIAPAAIAPSLGRAIRFLYRKLDVLDHELCFRFMDWFAHHLSNFDFKWKWVEWIPDLDFHRLVPQKAFILGTLDKETRLSFAVRIRQNTPEEYHRFIPSTKGNDIPPYKYLDEQTPFSQQGREVVSLLRKKASEEDVQLLFDRIHAEAADRGYTDPVLASTDVYVTAVCYIGSKSLSHILSYIERCKERLLAIGPSSPAARKQIVESVVNYWREQNPGVAVNIVDKLLNYTILTPLSVIEWALIDSIDGGKFLSETWAYEMVSSTVFKVTNRVRQIVAARNQRGIPAEQIALLEETLLKEREEMRGLFGVIERALLAVAETDHSDMSTEAGEELAMGKTWASKWLRIFSRKLVVEEAVLTEMLKIEPEPAVEIEANGSANGNGHGVADGDGDLDIDAV